MKKFFAVILFSTTMIACAQGQSGSKAEKLCQSTEQNASHLLESFSPAVETLSLNSKTSYIVTLKDDDLTAQQLKQELLPWVQEAEGVRIEKLDGSLFRLEVEKQERVKEVLDRAIQNREIEYLESDSHVKLEEEIEEQALAQDPGFNRQWAHQKVQSLNAWSMTQGRREVIVGVIDSGSDPGHPDLASNMWRNPRETANGRDDDGNGLIDDVVGWNFANNNSRLAANDKSFHGTHVSGTIAALRNAIGVVGHAPQVRLMPLKYIGSNGSGMTSNAIRAIDYGIRMGAKILNASWGSESRSKALENAIQRAAKAGVLFIAAAGNYGTNIDRKPFFPASFAIDNIISVSASDTRDQLAAWSNFGALNSDLAAPGVQIYSTSQNGLYATLSGTSMATPLVSGVAALVWSLRPDFSYRDVKQVLLSSVDHFPQLAGKVKTAGRINAFKALQMARNFTRLPNSGVDPVVEPPDSACH